MQRGENERMAQAFLDRGWNADGSEPAWHKLATNKSFSNLSKNMLMPMAEMAVGEGVGGMLFKGTSIVSGTGVSKLVGYGSDAAIVENTANLLPKKGWYDIVVHGTEDGLGFTVNKQFVSPQQLYKNILADGYQQGTKIRLLSCYSGSIEGGAASQLSKLANAPVAAPQSWLSISNGQGFLPKGKFMVGDGQRFKMFNK